MPSPGIVRNIGRGLLSDNQRLER